MCDIRKNKYFKRISSLILFCTILGYLFLNVEQKVYANDIVVYSQTDSRWANSSYGLGPNGTRATISSSGCGILSYVNAVQYMTGNFIEPVELANWSVNNGYRINGVGTSFGLYRAYAKAYGNKYGFKYSGSVANVTEAKTHLQNGGAAIISVPGHLMALVDYNANNGKYLILDSYRSSNRGTYPSGYRWLGASEFTGKLAVSAVELISPINSVKVNNPVGEIDFVTGGVNSINIRGWAFDEDDFSQALNIHVYIGGPAGSGAPGYPITANKERTDVGNAYAGAGNYHGYEETIATDRVGEQDVYIYAINVGGGDINTLLGVRRVDISDGYIPIGYLDGVGTGEGYVDVSGWTLDQDLPLETISLHIYIGGPAGSNAEGHIIHADKFRTDVGAAYPQAGNYHGFENRLYTNMTGNQMVYVYAINVGKGTSNPLLDSREVTIKEKSKVYSAENVSIVYKSGSQCTNEWIDKVGSTLQLYAKVYPENATNQKVTWSTSDSSVLSVDANGKVTAKGNGAAYVIAKTEDGGYVSKCWIKVGMENIKYGDINFDDKITTTDLSTISQVINGSIILPEAQKVIIDVNGDGQITQNDYDLVNQYISKLIDVFPVEKMLSEIKITKAPTKQDYYKGESLSTAGMEVMAIYKNGETAVVTNYNTSGDLNTSGKQKITVSHTKDDITKTVFFYIQVHDIELEKIAITQRPDKISYVEGEEIEFSGLKVRAYYTNGTSKNVDNYTLMYKKDLSIGENEITILYQENGKMVSTSQKITVVSLCEVNGHEWWYQENEDLGTHTKICTICGEETIQNCTLSSVMVEPTDTQDGYVEESCKVCQHSCITEVLSRKFVVDENGLLTDYTGNETNVVIPDSVTSIGYYAFRDCISITRITIPKSVTSIGIAAFAGCTNLKEIVIPDSVTSIGIGAFQSCKKLEEIVIPNSVTSIGGDAFWHCESLKKIILPDNLKEVSDGMFYECDALEKIVLPESVTRIGEQAFWQCGNLKELTVPDAVTSIGKQAFSGCCKLVSIDMPESLVDIGAMAFEFCYSLNNLRIPDKVVSIGMDAFCGCSGIKGSIVIPGGVMILEDAVFAGCSSITGITIPNTITNIKRDAFRGCKMLKSIEIPESVTEIGENVFYGCNDIVIYGKTGSYAESYANENGIKFYTQKICPTYTVMFDENGGTNLSYITKEVEENQKIGTLPSVERNGYRFNGWYTAANGGIKIAEDTVITNDIILYAQWEKESISIEGAEISLSENSYNYNGNEIKPKVVSVILKDTVLKENIDYIVSYENNINVGTASVVITGKGNYYGIVIKAFNIKEKEEEQNSSDNSEATEKPGDTNNPDDSQNIATGLAQSSDGNWYYYKDGKIDTSFSGLYCDETVGWWLVNKGSVDFNYTGLYYDMNYGWWLVNGGSVDFGYTGLYYDVNCGWWLIGGGAVCFDYNGLWGDPVYGWWLVNGGSVDFGYTGLYYDVNCGWWLIGGGSVCFDYNGLWGDPVYGWWLVNGGSVDFGYTGLYNDINCGWWYIEGGAVNFDYTGEVYYEGAPYYVRNGQLL